MTRPHTFITVLYTLAVFLSSCTPGNSPAPPPKETQLSLPTPQTNSQLTPQGSSRKLFKDEAEPVNREPDPAHVIRSRFVNFNTSLLLNAKGFPLDMEPGTQIEINLFPDVIYVGVIEEIQENGSQNYTWIGYLEDVQYSYMYIVYTEGVFIGHFASPEGVYEVHYKKDNLYQVILIDQTQMPQE